MAKWMVPAVITVLLTGCGSVPTKTIDAQTVSAVRNQSVAIVKRDKPNFAATTVGNSTFGVIGGVVAIAEGNKIIADNNVQDPADAIAATLASAMQSSQGVQLLDQPLRVDTEDAGRIAGLAKGKARFVLDVQTVGWSLIYFPTDWTHYRIMHFTKARLIDADSGAVVAEGACKQMPESNLGAPTYDELMTGGAAGLKALLAKNARACATDLGRDMLALQLPAIAPETAVAAAAPAPAAAPGLKTAPAPVAGPGNWSGIMACDARSDSGARAQAYEARFAVEVQGNAVNVHRRTPEVEESLSGQAANGQLELMGTGHRVGEPARPWRLAVSGAFPEGATSYQGKGAMSANGRQLRKCELRLTRS